MIFVENLTVGYGDYTVLEDVNLELGSGLHYLLGKNGSGKSTLLKAIAGLLRPSKGRVLVFNKDIHRVPRREAVKIVGYAWQNPYAGFVEATVRDELEFTSRLVGVELNSEIVEVLVPKHLLEKNPFNLSGGEAKRVSLASVLALDQPVWLLDEPFDYLDSDGVEAVLRVINYGLEKGKVVVVASSHLSYLYLLKPKQVLVLFEKRVAYRGSAESLMNNSLLKNLGVPSKEMICGPGN